MESKTVLEIFREKICRYDYSVLTNLTSSIASELSNEVERGRLEDISSQVQRDAPYLLNNRGRSMLKLMGIINNVSVIKSWLHNDLDRLPPLELLCFLHGTGVMQITTFLYYKPEYCARISCQLVEMVTTEFADCEDQAAVEGIVKTVLSSMINVGSHSLRQLLSLSSSVMESFTATLIDVLFSCGSDTDLKLDFVDVVLSSRCGFESGVRSFAAFLLNSLLTHDPGSVDFRSAVGLHHKQWKSHYIPNKFTALYNQLEMLLSREGIMQEIQLLLEDGKINLKHLLYVVSLMSQDSNQSDHSDVAKASADKWFKEALNDRNEFRLGVSLLVTRHYFAEISKYFVNYSNWFGAVQVKTVLTFNFFFEFLSKLVPYEPAVFLKIQVTKVPCGPTGCQGVATDYMSLAKTRLADMNQNYDYISLFNDFHETIDDQKESDVNRVLTHFSESGEVAKAVLEASVFRKQYYEKVFLPSLLSVPRGTDPSRDQIIIKLNTMGKLPSSLYRVWSKSRS